MRSVTFLHILRCSGCRWTRHGLQGQIERLKPRGKYLSSNQSLALRFLSFCCTGASCSESQRRAHNLHNFTHCPTTRAQFNRIRNRHENILHFFGAGASQKSSAEASAKVQVLCFEFSEIGDANSRKPSIYLWSKQHATHLYTQLCCILWMPGRLFD